MRGRLGLILPIDVLSKHSLFCVQGALPSVSLPFAEIHLSLSGLNDFLRAPLILLLGTQGVFPSVSFPFVPVHLCLIGFNDMLTEHSLFLL